MRVYLVVRKIHTWCASLVMNDVVITRKVI